MRLDAGRFQWPRSASEARMLPGRNTGGRRIKKKGGTSYGGAYGRFDRTLIIVLIFYFPLTYRNGKHVICRLDTKKTSCYSIVNLENISRSQDIS